jgi:hypothetical protein
MIVKDTLTPLSRDDASRALLTAYLQLTGALPTPGVLALLLAQSAFETGHWKSLHNFNFGNAKAGLDYPLITQFHCSEVDEHGVEHFYDPPDPHCNFRAYDNAAAGALDHLKVLQHRPTWWQGLHTEDPSAFVDALATPPKYFTGNVAVYKRSVVSLFGTFHPLAEVALAVASVRPAPVPAPLPLPVPAPSSSSGSPRSGSSGAPLVPASNGSTADPAPTAPAAPPTPPAPVSTVPAPPKSAFWQQVVDFVRRFLRLLLGAKPPAGSA